MGFRGYWWGNVGVIGGVKVGIRMGLRGYWWVLGWGYWWGRGIIVGVKVGIRMGCLVRLFEWCYRWCLLELLMDFLDLLIGLVN